MVSNPPASAGDARDAGLIPGLGRSSGGGNGNPLQYSCLENPHGQRNLVDFRHDWSDLACIHTNSYSSVFQLCPTLCNPIDCSIPGFPALHHLPELAQTQVHWVSDAIQPSHLLSSSSPAFDFSQHQGQFFPSVGQIIGVSPSASVLPMNIQDLFPLEWTCWISLQSKGLSRVFSNTTVQKHQFFGAHLSLQSNSQIHTWLLEKP